MTIPPELEAEIRRLHHSEKWPPGTIARQLRVHHSAVERVLAQDGKPPSKRPRASLVDPYLPFIEETLERYPTLPSSRLYVMVRERGYPGRPSHFRQIVASLRPRSPAEAYLRLRTLPAEEAQVDWAHFGRLEVGRAQRPLMAFLYVLSYSRAPFLRFFHSQALANFLRGHKEAFDFLGGSARVTLYDNLRSVVLERVGRAIRFHPLFLAFAAHYRFEPRPVALARGNEKGRVERTVQFARSSFFSARRFRDLQDLNRQARQWCLSEALDRRWPDDSSRSVREVFEEEKVKLLPLPADPFPTAERVEVSVGKSPYVRFDLNDYSVPHERTRRSLTVLADEETVRIFDSQVLLATHQRSFDRGRQIEDPAHLEALSLQKRAGRRARRLGWLARAVPASETFLEKLAERGLRIGPALRVLEDLLRLYGSAALEEAVTEALRHHSPHAESVRHILERQRALEGEYPPVPIPLPDDPRLRNLTVRPHDLSAYDKITSTPSEEDLNHAHEDRDRHGVERT